MIVKSIKNLFGTVVSIASFGVIKLNKDLRQNNTVKILSVEMEKIKLGRLKNQDKYIAALQDKKVNEKNLERYKNERKMIFEYMIKAKDSEDIKKFTSLSVELKTKDEMIKNAELAVSSLDNALKTILSVNETLEQKIQQMKGQIEILGAKQTMADTFKTVNKVMEDLYAPNGTSNTTNLEELNKEWDDELVKEQTKAEVLSQFDTPMIDHTEFNNKEDMEHFLHENYVE